MRDRVGDLEVWRFAREQGYTIVSKDSDNSSQPARPGVGQRIRSSCQTGSDRNAAHGSIHASHRVQTQSRSPYLV